MVARLAIVERICLASDSSGDRAGVHLADGDARKLPRPTPLSRGAPPPPAARQKRA